MFGLLDYVPTISYEIRRKYEGALKISGDFPDGSLGFSIAVPGNEPLLASTIEKIIQYEKEIKLF